MSAETIPSQETAKQDAAGLLKNIHELLEAAKNPDKASEVGGVLFLFRCCQRNSCSRLPSK